MVVFRLHMPSLGLVIPTYNSHRYLKRHVKGLLSWIDLVQEIMVVDSHSTDGSAEFLQEHLPHPNLRVVQHPPGLYASWNSGVAQLQTEFFIMSTTGDTISRDGVEKLMQCAGDGQCDIVISKPIFRDLADRVHDIRWPIDDILEKAPVVGGCQFLSGLEALVYAMARPDSALLGSSASNLYRTRFFQERPFPLDWGVGGDGGWVWEHAAEARWGVLSGNYSTFLIHPPQSQKKDLRPAVKHELDEVLGRSVERWVSQGVITQNDLEKIGWPSLQKSLRNYLDTKESFDATRRKKGLWILRPSAWMQRSRRKKAAVSLHKARDLALTACQDGKI
jgi:glycosyltransferase involved in cell wall biosynthesis